MQPPGHSATFTTEVTYGHFRCDGAECSSLGTSDGLLVVPLTNFTNGLPNAGDAAFISQMNVINGVYAYQVLMDGSSVGVSGPAMLVGACTSSSILSGSCWVEVAAGFAAQPSCQTEGDLQVSALDTGYIVDFADCSYLADPDFIGAPSSINMGGGMYGASFSNGELDTNGLFTMADQKPTSGLCSVAFMPTSSFVPTDSYVEESSNAEDSSLSPWKVLAAVLAGLTALLSCLAAAIGLSTKCCGLCNRRKTAEVLAESYPLNTAHQKTADVRAESHPLKTPYW